MRDTFTRDELLHALRLEPCHITGMHDPEHHLKYVCNDQRAAAFERVLALLDVPEDDLPHALHDERCGWCHRVPSQEEYRERNRRTHVWAGVSVPPAMAAPAPDHPKFDLPKRTVLRAVKRLAKGGRWVHRRELQEALDLPMHPGHKLGRPLGALVRDGKLEESYIDHTHHVRPPSRAVALHEEQRR